MPTFDYRPDKEVQNVFAFFILNVYAEYDMRV